MVYLSAARWGRVKCFRQAQTPAMAAEALCCTRGREFVSYAMVAFSLKQAKNKSVHVCYIWASRVFNNPRFFNVIRPPPRLSTYLVSQLFPCHPKHTDKMLAFRRRAGCVLVDLQSTVVIFLHLFFFLNPEFLLKRHERHGRAGKDAPGTSSSF